MRLTYSTPVVSISGTTGSKAPITLRPSLQQQIGSRHARPRPQRTPHQAAARAMFHFLKAAYHLLSAAQVLAWTNWARDQRERMAAHFAPPTPWAAYWTVNSARYMQLQPPTAVPPQYSSTYHVITISSIRYNSPPALYVYVFLTLSADATNDDWGKLTISATLPSSQRHASPSEMVLTRPCNFSNLVTVRGITSYLRFNTDPQPWAHQDYVQAQVTPYNANYLPGIPHTWHGKITVV